VSAPLRILFIEDREDDMRLVQRELRRGGLVFDSKRVDTAADLEAALAEPWDVILCDYAMPGFGGMAAYAMVKARGLDLPFIMVSGTIGEEAAVEVMRAGVHDFVLKDRTARLVPAIERELVEAQRRDELRRAEATLLRTEKLRALGQMAAGVAHDFKNLLNPLGLHVELVERALRRAGADRPESIGVMREIIQRGVQTIDRLRTFSRIDPEPVAEYVDLAAVAREAVTLIRPRLHDRPGLDIREELEATGRVRAHGAELVGALVNLLVNAADACGDRGVITVRTGVEGGRAWVEVADDGPGMTPDVEARAFEPFFSTKGEQGTGLGLANVFATARRYGGDIHLTTAPGRGASFQLSYRQGP
jgi:signal transduction histidine kinase